MVNFIRHIVLSFIAVDSSRRNKDIYEKMPGMTRQNFQQYLVENRTVAPTKWVNFRKALGMSREDFWAEAMDFYDPE